MAIIIKSTNRNEIPTPEAGKVTIFHDTTSNDIQTKNSSGTLKSAGGSNKTIWEWNETDLTQFTQTGSSDIAYSVDNGGPDGSARILATALNGDNDASLRFLVINDLTVAQLGSEYEVQVYLGPYNNSSSDKAVFSRICPVFTNTGNYIGLQNQAATANFQQFYNNDSLSSTGDGSSTTVMDSDSSIDKQLAQIEVRMLRSTKKIYIKIEGAAGEDRWEPGHSMASTTNALVAFSMAHTRSGGTTGDTGWISKLKIVKI